MKKITKLLVANRGEIALRILRSAKEMGIATVAIYSEADRLAPHVRYADEAVCVGPPASKDSYLRGDKIIEICHELGVDAIHPGYGFLSENAGFARAVRAAGLLFVGPSPEAMEIMGDKLSAKQAVKAYDIPLVPGTDEAITDVAAARQIAQEVGFPILIKASAGRRQGYAPGAKRRRVRGADAAGRKRGHISVWRRGRIYREIRHWPAPHRNSGLGRRARKYRAFVRARVLDSAAASEGD